MLKQLPHPTGSFHVGVTHLSFIDEKRMDTFFPATREHPNIPVMIWYPIDEPNVPQKNTYINEALFNQFNISPIIRRLFKRQFLQIYSNSAKNCPISTKQKGYPVILFNQGGGACMEMYYSRMELLASYGYIVVSIGHPYICVLTYPNGTIISPNQSIDSIFSKIVDESIPIEQRKEFSQQFMDFQNRSKSTFIMIDTIQFIITTLEKLNSGEIQSIFHNKLNLTKGMGIFGHSIGGSPSILASGIDSRISCAISLDGNMDGAFDPKAKFNKPSLYMVRGDLPNINKLFAEITSADSYHLKIGGANHMDFTDSIHLRTLFSFGSQKKKKEAARLVSTIDSYLVAFFNKYLLDLDSDLLRTCPFPMCEFWTKKKP